MNDKPPTVQELTAMFCGRPDFQRAQDALARSFDAIVTFNMDRVWRKDPNAQADMIGDCIGALRRALAVDDFVLVEQYASLILALATVQSVNEANTLELVR